MESKHVEEEQVISPIWIARLEIVYLENQHMRLYDFKFTVKFEQRIFHLWARSSRLDSTVFLRTERFINRLEEP